MKKEKTIRGLALEGGGAKGSYEIGAYLALKKMGIKFDMVAGTSIGSLNAALIVQGNMKLAKKLWLTADSEIIGLSKNFVKIYKNFKINKENIKISFDEIKKVLKNKGLNISTYKEIIDTYISEEKIRASKVKYGLVTVRLKDLKPLEITIKEIQEGKLSEYILASSYLPIFKMNKIIDDSYYLDGGFSNNLPITLLEKNGCNEIFAIKINGIGNQKKKLFSKSSITVISPTKDTGPVILFDNKDIQENFKMGYYDTLLKFDKICGYKYYFKKFTNAEYIIRKIDNSLLNLIKLKYKTPDLKEIIIRSIEDILEYNSIYYYRVYKIKKIIKFIKNNNLKCMSKIVNDFVHQLNY